MESPSLTQLPPARQVESLPAMNPHDWFGRSFVLIESRFRETDLYTEKANVLFAKRVCLFAIAKGMNPFASHLFYTQFLDDTNEDQRNLGIHLGMQWSRIVQNVWFCLREGEPFSDGMHRAYRFYSHVTSMNLSLMIFDRDDLSHVGSISDPEMIRQRAAM